MLKPILVAFFASSGLLAAAAAAQTPSQQAQAPGCGLPAIVDAVGLEDVPGTNLRTVPVTINGAKKQFLLDIGNNITEVSEAAVKDLALPDIRNAPSDHLTLSPGVDTYKEQTGKANFNMNVQVPGNFIDVKGSGSAENSRPHVRIASFTLGDATGKNLTFAVSNDREMGNFKSKPYDGLMTGDFFKQYDVELDFAANKLNYLTPTTCGDPHEVVFWPHAEVAIIPMTIEDDGRIHVQVMIQGHLINAVIDTSADHTVMRRGVAEQTLGFSAGKDMVPDGDRVDGMGQRIYAHIFPQIAFAGGVTAVNVPAKIQNYSMVHDLHREPVLGSRAQFSVTSDIPDLTLGMDVLQQLHLYIVPGQKNIYVTSAE